MGVIYQSDSTGTRFSVSLKDNVRSDRGTCDFEKVYGLDGVYIANIYENERIQ